jgi:hypothetical protein
MFDDVMWIFQAMGLFKKILCVGDGLITASKKFSPACLTHSQLLSLSEGRQLHPQPEVAQRHGDKGPT